MNAIQRKQRAKEFRESPEYQDFKIQKRLERKIRRFGYRTERKDSVFAFKPPWKNNNPATIWVIIGMMFLSLLMLVVFGI